MDIQTLSRLDEEELLHLAIDASRQQRHGDAIQYLKDAAAKAPRNARVRYLLGAEHAQIGLLDRAQEEMTAAVEIDPALVPARFQLGLLYLVRGRIAEASGAWKPLDELPESDPYLHFKRGLESLVQDDFARCEASVSRGMQLNTSNAPLNQDMQRILDEVKTRTGQPPAAPKPEASEHVLLSAYKGSAH
jgi:Flp pilus assembly protein TadD